MTIHIPASLVRTANAGGELLRTRPSWVSYWRAWLAAAGVFLLWYFQKWIFDGILRLLGIPYETSWFGLAVGLIPIVAVVLFHRYTHVFEIEGRQRLRSRIGFIARRIDEFSISPRVQASINQSVAGRLLDFGTIRFWTGDDRSELVWTGVRHPTRIAAFFNVLKTGNALVSADAAPGGTAYGDKAPPDSVVASGSGALPRGMVPPGTQLSDQVVVVPGLSDGFSHSGRLSGLLKQNYGWVERGAPIACYTIAVPRVEVPLIGALVGFFFGPIVRSAVIRSPANGIVLHATYDFHTDSSGFFRGKSVPEWERPIGAFAILLRKGEPAPEDGSWLFLDVCRLARAESRFFHRNSRYWSKGPIPPDRFVAMLDKQQALQCRVTDVLPTYREYIEEAATRLSMLAPYLAHIR